MTSLLRVFASIIVFVVLIMTSSCYSKKQMKLGLEFEKNTQYESAYDVYRGLYESKNHTEAQLAANRMAQAILTQKCTKADNLTMSGNYEGAKLAYDEAVDYSRQHISEKLNTNCLNFSFNNWKMSYGAHLSMSAKDALNDGNYSVADAFCDQFMVLGIDTNHEHSRSVQMTKKVCRLAPKFKEGQRLVEKKKWREAYKVFEEIALEDDKFKILSSDLTADEYLEMCVGNGKFNISFRYVETSTSRNEIEIDRLFDEIESAIGQDPFVSMYAQGEPLKQLEEELKKTMEPTYEQSDNSPQAGKFVSADYILMGKATNYRYERADANREKKTTCSCRDVPNIGEVSDEMTCFKIERTTTMSMDFNYKLMHVETGQIGFTNSFSKSRGAREVTSTGVFYRVESKKSGGLFDSMIDVFKDGWDSIMGEEDSGAKEGEYTSIALKSESQMQQELYELIAKSVQENLKAYSPKK
jgi:hypothetical protein